MWSSKREALLIIAASVCWLPGSVAAHAQLAGAASYSRQQLISLASQMRTESENGGATSDALERHLDLATTLAVRTRSGRAELHAAAADEFFVVEGHATLLTGGTILNPKGTAEVRGDSVQGGVRAELKAGDVVHIPANTPHQLLLDGADPFVYVLIKIPSA
jgi:mannose-6-phosphate isomerase-like protein (cupin superfamily)